MLSQEVLSAIYEFLNSDKHEENHYAIDAAKRFFLFFKEKFKSEIYQIFIENLENEFFEKIKLVDDEPYDRGRTEAIYFTLKKFKIPFQDYSNYLKKQLTQKDNN